MSRLVEAVGHWSQAAAARWAPGRSGSRSEQRPDVLVGRLDLDLVGTGHGQLEQLVGRVTGAQFPAGEGAVQRLVLHADPRHGGVLCGPDHHGATRVGRSASWRTTGRSWWSTGIGSPQAAPSQV